MSAVDSVGTYIFEVVESGLGLTKNGFPQWIARLKAVKKYIEIPEELAHFKLEAPAYVAWDFDEEINAFMVLFKDKEEYSDATKLLNYEQLQLATGWDGLAFDALSDLKGKLILGRVGENTYEGKTSLRVDWIDHVDASPERQLKVLDAAAVKGLTAKLKITAKAKPTAPAKPAAKPATAVKTAPTVAPPASGAAASAPPATTAAKTPTPAAAPKPPSKKKAATTPPSAEPTEEKIDAGLPVECTQMDGWNYVTTHKGENEDSVIEDAWLAACNEIGADRKEDDFTNADWGKVRNIVIRDLALNK